MKTNYYFEEKPIGKIVKTVYVALILNLCFTITTIPLLVSFLTIDFKVKNIGFFLLASCIFGPAFYSLMECLDRIYEENDLGIFRAYFSIWIKSLTRSIFYWLVTFVGAIIYLSNILFLKDTEYAFFNVVFTMLILWLIIIYLNVVYFSIRNPAQSFKNVLLTSFYYSIKKWPRGILNVLLLTLLIGFMAIKSPIGFIFLPSIITSIIYGNNKKLLEINLMVNKLEEFDKEH